MASPAMQPPNIQTYHCICTSLLLATTHTLSKLPRRAAPALDAALILPLPPTPPDLSADEDLEGGARKDLPAEGCSILLGVTKEKRPTIIRREDGFERRLLLRCSRCAVGVGYEILGDGEGGGKVVYLLPAGVVSTEVMARKGADEKGGRWIREDTLGIGKAGGAVSVFE